MRVLLLVVVAFACGKAGNAGEQAAADYVAKSAKKDLDELKAAIASPDPSKGKYSCAHMVNVDKLAQDHEALADELRQLCTKDLYLAMMKVEVEKVEAARKASSEDALLSECYNANFDLAKHEMIDAKTVELAADLIARFEAACPHKP